VQLLEQDRLGGIAQNLAGTAERFQGIVLPFVFVGGNPMYNIRQKFGWEINELGHGEFGFECTKHEAG
jgi:hypothetical protein